MAKETTKAPVGSDIPKVEEDGCTKITMPDPVVDSDKPIRSFEVPPATPKTIYKEGQPTQVIL